MNLLIAGDLVPTESNFDLFNIGDVNTLLGQGLHSIWNSANIRIFNLEAPITDIKSPIPKYGPNLIIPTSAMVGIKSLNPSLLTLANNHILDQGEAGILSTIDVLKKEGISYVGAGCNLFEASKPYIISKDGMNIGIYACAEHEFSIATENSPGANPFDPLESLDHIQEIKKQCDYVIVLYHGGKEHYRYPSPYLQKVCRKMAQKGADLVICQHSHCIGCFEEYEGTTIVYGQGNFIFDRSDNEFWKTSLLIDFSLWEQPIVEYIPIVKIGHIVRLAEEEKAQEILSEFKRRSKEIQKKGFIEKQYKEFAEKNTNSYLRTLSGFGKLISRLDRYLLNGFLLKRKYSKEKLLTIQNYIECEAHRELLLEGLRSKIGV